MIDMTELGICVIDAGHYPTETVSYTHLGNVKNIFTDITLMSSVVIFFLSIITTPSNAVSYTHLYQMLVKISKDINDGKIYDNKALSDAMPAAKANGKSLHLMGCLLYTSRCV